MNYKNLKYDTEGEYSLTYQKDANTISTLIKTLFGNVKILDATAGLGGNSISFGLNFTNVISIEINVNRCNLLKENLNLFKLNNTIICGDFLEHLDSINNDYDLVFVDPPWGGPLYKLKDSININIGNLMLCEITKKFINNNKNVVWKLPFNYDISEFKDFNYKIYNIRNYNVIIISYDDNFIWS
jgi:16S rRNA G966 N2-methylase RsmD